MRDQSHSKQAVFRPLAPLGPGVAWRNLSLKLLEQSSHVQCLSKRTAKLKLMFNVEPFKRFNMLQNGGYIIDVA